MIRIRAVFFVMKNTFQVMFENSRVGDVKIKNVQEDCCWDQLNGAEVSVLNDEMDAVKMN